MEEREGTRGWRPVAASAAVAGLMAVAIVTIFVVAPTERSMGDAQRILYVHVAVAWSGLWALVIMAGTAVCYLVRRDLKWDHWSQSAAELGWLCCVLTLVTGSLWARAAWGTWWTWDPRLTTTFILWAVCSGYLLLRGALEDPHRRARLAAVLAILAAMDLPLVVLATQWFRGIHPASPEMEPPMRAALWASIVAFSSLFAMLLAQRYGQLRLADALAALERKSRP